MSSFFNIAPGLALDPMSGFVRFWCALDDRFLQVAGADQTVDIGYKNYQQISPLRVFEDVRVYLGENLPRHITVEALPLMSVRPIRRSI